MGVSCAFQGCGKDATSAGLCSGHYYQKWKGRELTPIVHSTAPSMVGTTCGFESCDRPAIVKGLCDTHYTQQRSGKPLTPIQKRQRHEGPCSFAGCEQPQKGMGLCSGHRQQFLRRGILEPLRPQWHGKPCSFEGCNYPIQSHGYCGSHADQIRDGRELAPLRRRLPGVWGDWRMNSDGYRIRYRSLPDHPGKKEQQLEHRYVMEQHLGRKLRHEENIHHVNGDRTDNRLENLELWNTSQPKGQRIADKLAWAHELIARYEEAA